MAQDVNEPNVDVGSERRKCHGLCEIRGGKVKESDGDGENADHGK